MQEREGIKERIKKQGKERGQRRRREKEIIMVEREGGRRKVEEGASQ